MKEEKIEVRLFQSSDYDAVLALWKECDLPYKPNGRDKRGKILKEITQETATFLTAIEKGKVIGTVLATHDGRKGWINRLAVAPEFRGLGVAQRLLEEAEKSLHDRGLEIIACLIEDYNQVSMAFFQKAGYKKHNDIIYFSKRRHNDV
ncbi:MAG: GNAT family N-acetyltransferase [Acidobacteria bacterium]|jgi:ribosomal protein S18 acetylase RimI-like enzyme|nr:GNAT family N-acetyltransferase [Acidobacteriota bacterium]